MNEDKVVIGIVGKIGCGKSTVSKILTDEYRFQSIDVDKIGHLALEAMKDDVAKASESRRCFRMAMSTEQHWAIWCFPTPSSLRC